MDSKKGSREADLRTSAKESRMSRTRENVYSCVCDVLIHSLKKRSFRKQVV